MTVVMEAGRLELVPPAAPGFSPACTKEVTRRMRRVVTGEELAQLYNPDPFAMPRWRSPVYRTPLGIILVVQLVRLLAWLVRLIVPASAGRQRPGAAAVTWVNSAGSAWSSWSWPPSSCWLPGGGFWPVSFSRWVGRPARGKWRAWYYRRRWAAVMTIAGVAPWYQGRILLPVLGKVTATRYTDRVHVRLVSGQSAADFAKHADNLAHGFGALLCRVRTARSGRGGAGVRPPRRPGRPSSPPCPSPPTRISRRCRSAAARTACPGWSGCTARTS